MLKNNFEGLKARTANITYTQVGISGFLGSSVVILVDAKLYTKPQNN